MRAFSSYHPSEGPRSSSAFSPASWAIQQPRNAARNYWKRRINAKSSVSLSVALTVVYSQTLCRVTGCRLFIETPPMNEAELNSPPVHSIAKTENKTSLGFTPNIFLSLWDCPSSRRVSVCSYSVTIALVRRLDSPPQSLWVICERFLYSIRHIPR